MGNVQELSAAPLLLARRARLSLVRDVAALLRSLARACAMRLCCGLARAVSQLISKGELSAPRPLSPFDRGSSLVSLPLSSRSPAMLKRISGTFTGTGSSPSDPAFLLAPPPPPGARS